MAVIKVNTKKLNDAKSLIKQNEIEINMAINYSNKVEFPHGSVNWASIKSELEDCKTKSDTYFNWINEQSKKIDNIVNDAVVNIYNINVEEVNKNIV